MITKLKLSIWGSWWKSCFSSSEIGWHSGMRIRMIETTLCYMYLEYMHARICICSFGVCTPIQEVVKVRWPNEWVCLTTSSNTIFNTCVLHGFVHITTYGRSFQYATSTCKTMLYLSFIVPFHKLQNNFETSFSFELGQIEQDSHLFSLEIQ